MDFRRRILVPLVSTAAVLTVCAAVASCGSGTTASGSTRPVTLATTTTTTLWNAPASGVFVRVADIPDIEAVTEGSLVWAFAAAECRRYDAAHGTVTSITVGPADSSSAMGHPEANTACMDGNGYAVAR